MSKQIDQYLTILQMVTNKTYHVVIDSNYYNLMQFVGVEHANNPDDFKYEYQDVRCVDDEEALIGLMYNKILLEYQKNKTPNPPPEGYGLLRWVPPDEIELNSPHDEYSNRVLMRFNDLDTPICTGRFHIEEGGYRIWETDTEWPTFDGQFFDLIACAEIPK